MENIHKNQTRFVKVPLVAFLNKHLIDYPTPSNINYFWGFGSLAGIMLLVQIITGILLAMHYVPTTTEAFASVEHIMRNVNNGWLLRYLHSNGASMFFVVVYVHIARGLYYRSYLWNAALWISGVIILFLMMGTAFIGYVLPWGQMSFWGATVITNLVTAIPSIGIHIAQWLWGGFAVDNPTLKRFFSLHYLLPIILAAVAVIHLVFLHEKGSTSPIGHANPDKISFHPYFTFKDLLGLLIFLIFYFYFVFFNPNVLAHPDNYIEANPLVTPLHIVPEWYFLPFYAILRACPDKIGGVLSMVLAIVILAFLPLLDKDETMISPEFIGVRKFIIMFAFANFVLLGWLGGQPAEQPFVFVSQVASVLYFSLFFINFIINSLANYFKNK